VGKGVSVGGGIVAVFDTKEGDGVSVGSVGDEVAVSGRIVGDGVGRRSV